jgi:hypothetical protein
MRPWANYGDRPVTPSIENFAITDASASASIRRGTGRATAKSVVNGVANYRCSRPPLRAILQAARLIQKRSATVKHAGSAALGGLSELLDQIRTKAGLKEKSVGIFYRKSKSFLHFHEDPAGLFADLNAGGDFARYPVNSQHEWQVLLSAIDRAIEP